MIGALLYKTYIIGYNKAKSLSHTINVYDMYLWDLKPLNTSQNATKSS